MTTNAAKVVANTQSDMDVKSDHKLLSRVVAERVAKIRMALAVTSMTNAHALAEPGSVSCSIH